MTADINFAKRIDQYVRLRDKIKKMKENFDAELEPFATALEQLNNMILDHLNKVNSDSVATPMGTAYRTAKKSASLADPDLFMNYVITQGAWDLLDRKANVTAVEDFITNNKSPPPGVNFSKVFVAGVRRK